MKPTSPIIFRLTWCCGLLLCALATSPRARGDDFHAGFDEDRPSWKTNYKKSEVELLSHRRHPTIFVRGRASENFEFDASTGGRFVQLEHTLPAARVFDELKLSLWVRSNRPGAALFVRVVFPHQVDPDTEKQLHTFVRGDTYADTGRWQQLSCSTPQRLLDEKLRRIRARLKETRVDLREAYVDRVYVTTKLEKGTTEFFLDELKLGPLVEAKTKTKAEVLQASEADDNDHSPVEFRLDQLRVEGIPFFPRIVPHHGESPEVLSRARANVVWVPHLDDKPLIDRMHRAGLWVTATPPRIPSSAGENVQNSLSPFTADTRPVLFWNLGLQIPPEAKDALVAWKHQIENADRVYRRPLLADVSGLERVYSQHIGMLGLSRFPIGTSLTPLQYRDWLIQKRKLASPGSFVWTWIQTEMNVPAGENADPAASRAIIVEPGQLRLQTYAALAAGCRGIGYWKTESLNSSGPAALERRLAITQLNLELELIEPWLATGTVVEHVPFRVSKAGLKIGRRSIDFRRSARGRIERDALLDARDNALKAKHRQGGELQATIIRSDYGTLLLPVWYGQTGFFVPGQMSGNDATIVALGVERTASAWLVTPTRIRNLETERITGGVKITIPRFNQTAAVILTADQALVAKIRRKVQGMAEQSARVSIDLVRAQLARVRRVDAELKRLEVGQLDAPQLLASATKRLARAEDAFRHKDFPGAREMSGEAGQLLRILQSDHWHDAVRSLSSPTAGPFTVCFQTLPDHWRLMADLGRTQFKNDANILASGDFQDINSMIANGWKHSQNEIEDVKAGAELYRVTDNGNYALRLVAVADVGREPPRVIEVHPVTVTTPAMPVSAGQIVHVSGRVRIIGPIAGSLDGVMLYDNQSGSQRALRWNQSAGWKQFDLLRKIERDSDFQITIALTGLGEAQFDDIRVVPHSPRVQTAGATAPSGTGTLDRRQPAWDFMPKLPKWSNPLPGIQKSLPKLENPFPKLNGALPRWDRIAPQTPVPTTDPAATDAPR